MSTPKIIVAIHFALDYNKTTPTTENTMNLYIRLIITLAVVNVAVRYFEIQ